MTKTSRTPLLPLVLATFLVPTASSAEPLSLWISSFQDQKYYEAMVELYRERVDPDFEAEVQAYGFQEMPEKVAVAVRTGVNVPDVVQLDEIFFSMYLNDEIPFRDLTDHVKKAGLDEKLLPQRLELFQFQGRQYGLPQSVSAMVLYHRSDVFEQYEIAPEDVDTWQEFRDVGEHLLAEYGQSLLALDWSYFEVLLRQRGHDLFGDDGGIQFDSPVAVESLEFLAELQTSGIGRLPDRGHIFDPEFFGGDVIRQEIVAIVGAGWYGLDMLHEYAPTMSGKWRVLPLPAWGDEKNALRTSTFAGQGLMIFGASPRADEAWKFLQFIMEDADANATRFTEGNSFTAYVPMWDDPRLKAGMEYFGGQSLGELLASLAPAVPRVKSSPLRPLFLHLFREKYFSAVMRGNLTAKEALTQLRQELEQAAERR